MFKQGSAMSMRSKRAFLIGVIFSTLLGCMPHAIADETTIRYFPVGPIYEYRWKLLELALSHTREGADAPPRLQPYTGEVTHFRGIALLREGKIDVMALALNAEREAQMLPIRIDILRGMLGYRLLLIRAADQERIALMGEKEVREKLTFGFNSQWADLSIMKSNGFTVVTSVSYENLFGMLNAGRFDAFPRGLNEAPQELEQRKSTFPGMAIEKTKALYYPYPVYFWVDKDNKALAHRIERGLQLALADGSFRRLFETYHSAEIARVRGENRHVIRLKNPILPPEMPEPDTSWWRH